MSGPRYVCVHGHFYQPPRENPWLETVEPQESAAPYRDWNARITAECYRPNAAARIVEGYGRIIRVVNNYARMSFNFGPTLLSWLESEAPDVYRAILEADRYSIVRFNGHGSAMAQAYNHMILPLASRRDIRTQVVWGIRDFQHRFGRRPIGMWLPETAVSTESLEVLAEHGIAFTVLSPYQAQRVRRAGGEWHDARDGRIDPGRVYRCPLPSGRSIDLFFYDGPTSRAVAFEQLLADGHKLADRLTGRAGDPSGEPLLQHIATDGETYGHHHRFGDMALAWALEQLQSQQHEGAVRLTNYAEFRARHPAGYEVEIAEDTAWSCSHGVGRWRDDCGCSSGSHPSWHQAWRRPLRDALDWLRDRVADVFEAEAGRLLRDPWAARDAYIDVILARSPSGNPDEIDRFFAGHALAPAPRGSAPRQRMLELLEMQRHAMLMYTSCGWFFDDLAGIETVQVLQYAGRVVELAEQLSGSSIEPGFLERLSQAHSNQPQRGNGIAVYEANVRTPRVDLRNVVAHYAVSQLFDPHSGRERIYCYDVDPHDLLTRQTGKARLAAGSVRCTSRITGAAVDLSFAALHTGEHNLSGGVRSFPGREVHGAIIDDLTSTFLAADMIDTQRLLDRHFPELTFSLRSLFKTERDRVIGRILQHSLNDAEGVYQRLYDFHASLLRYLASLDVPLPEAFHTAAAFVLKQRLHRALLADPASPADIDACMQEAAHVHVDLMTAAAAYDWSEALHRAIDYLARHVEDLGALERVAALAELAAKRGVDADLWHVQNECWTLLQRVYPLWRAAAGRGDGVSLKRVAAFSRLCRAVKVSIDAAPQAVV